MLKKPIKYKDLEENDVEGVFYFNMSKAELAIMELSEQGGMESYLERLIESKNNKEIVGLFQDIIKMSIGERDADGVRFRKSEEITRAFVETDAYSVLFIELISDAKAGADFVNGIMPKDIQEQMAADEAAKHDEGAKLLAENRDLTPQEFKKLTVTQQGEAFRAKMERDSNADASNEKSDA